MHKDKDDGMHRSRDLTAFDHTLLDGEMFLQVIIFNQIHHKISVSKNNLFC